MKLVISDVSPMELALPVDKTTTDLNCISIQSILTHILYAGYSYANYIRKLKNAPFKLWEKATRPVIADYENDLDQMFSYTIETFGFFNEEETMQPTSNKILTHWGQSYDLEQMWEHAIVHVLRHRRQIEKFKKIVG
ncbi:MAG: DinB family protein [Bacillota bacterium]|nr:DinB family protein [Bacillota bacterium]